MRLLGLVRGEHVDLRLVVHRVPQVQARAGFEIARLEAAFEQQHRAAPAEGANSLGFGQVEQRETVGALQTGVGALDAVAVGIGLDDGPDLRTRRRGAGALQVVRQRVGVDQGFDGARHVKGPSLRDASSASILPARPRMRGVCGPRVTRARVL